MKKILLLISLAILLALQSVTFAQTTTYTLQWDHLTDTVANVNLYVFTMKLDAAAVTQVTPSCVASPANVTCSTPIALTSGNHTIIVTATNGTGTGTGTLNYIPGNAPANPSSIRVVIKITVP